MSQRRPLHVVSFAIPILSPREAEAIIDVLEKVKGALWDAYGDAIAGLPDHDSDEDDRPLGDDPEDLPPS